jgi:DNA-binding PadR family transcriptional regulator
VSVKHGLLALLSEGPRYGYELKAGFEARTGDAWPLNVGQVYTTLARLERDGQVARDSEDAEGHVHYRLTEAGRRELQAWWDGEVERAAPPRDELAIKIALALTVPGVDVPAVLQRQRTATVRALQGHTRRRRALDGSATAAALVLDSLVFAAEAEVRWLDHCEARLARSRRPVPSGPAPAPSPVPLNGARA